jgi:1,4-alpha-glucan branching enzyme
MVSDLNKLYKTEPALYLYDSEHKGFEWIERTDNLHNTISFFRKSDDIKETIIVVCNFADRVRENYRVAVPLEGEYEILFNSQDEKYNGWNIENKKIFQSKKELAWNKEYLIEFNMPALAVIYFKIKK